MMSIKKIYRQWLERKAFYFHRVVEQREEERILQNMGYLAPTAIFRTPDYCPVPQKLFLYDHTSLDSGAKFLISDTGEEGKFIMKHHAEVATGLTVITKSVKREVGEYFADTEVRRTNDVYKDVVIEEDVWVGANVTLLQGVKIGRGAIVGAGCVCAHSVPPYAIVMGNPAKVVGFAFTPEEVIEHEAKLYPEEERLRLGVLQRNYDRYYTKRLNEIMEILK